MMMVVNPKKVPVNTVKELIDYVKANPGKLSYASTGVGSMAHLSVELFKVLTATDMVHIPPNRGHLRQIRRGLRSISNECYNS